MLTEIQVEYTQRLQNETNNVFQTSAYYFERTAKLDIAKATLENVLTETQNQELNSQWKSLDLTSEAFGGNDLMVVLMAKSKTINNSSDFRAFRDFFSNLIKVAVSNQANIRYNETLLENLRDELKSTGTIQLENVFLEIEEVKIYFSTYFLSPLLKLEKYILEGEDAFGFKRAPFPEEYKTPIRTTLSKIDGANCKLSNASTYISYILEFDVSPKGYDKHFRTEHERYTQELSNIKKAFIIVHTHNSDVRRLGSELIEGQFGLGEYQNYVNGGDFAFTKPHTQCLEILGNYKKVVEKEKNRLEAVREEGDKSILNELGQLILLSREIESVTQELSSAKEENAEAYHELIQLVHDVVKNSKYY
jgi:hypothetical protein